MIFVTVGMHNVGFERLVKKMDEIAGKIDEEVIIQKGYTRYEPKKAIFFNFVTEKEIKELSRKARVVVTHGAMSMIEALQQGSMAIAVPRLKEYREIIDDHQLYLVQALEQKGWVKAVYDVNDLEAVLQSTLTAPVIERDRRLVIALRTYLDKVQAKLNSRGSTIV